MVQALAVGHKHMLPGVRDSANFPVLPTTMDEPRECPALYAIFTRLR